MRRNVGIEPPSSHDPSSSFPSHDVHYDDVDALAREEDGALRILRRRGPFGLLHRDIFHPAKDRWREAVLGRDGGCVVRLGDGE